VHVLPPGSGLGPERRRQVLSRSQLLVQRLRAQTGAEAVALRRSTLQSVLFAIVAMAAVALVVWRGVALFNYTFHKRDL